ncbi:DUF5412 family protein [Sporosarcina siberiensis]|uniref:DUF5412 family protein n=1 Tax=Sporosarcina siberiensis TaxID=1365606 RepID=A0ABW4SE05_9BACL
MFGLLISFVTLIIFLILSVKIIISFIKKKPFPKKMLIAMIFGVFLVSSIYVYEVYFFTFDDIDKEFIQNGPGPILSPTEEYTANAYYEPYGGAAGGVNVWVEITKHHENDNKKIIYYSDANNNILLDWADEKTLFITNAGPYKHNSMKLDVETEIYHDRGLACRSWLMMNEYETCYQK